MKIVASETQLEIQPIVIIRIANVASDRGKKEETRRISECLISQRATWMNATTSSSSH